MQPEKARDHHDNDDYADDVENIHCLAPIKECAVLEIALTLSSAQRRWRGSVPDQIRYSDRRLRLENALDRRIPARCLRLSS